MTSQYTELHLHDYYSTLDGLNSPAEYFARCKELGMDYLAQTNHGTLSGHREFQREAKEAGIVPILGVEAYISPTDRFDRRSKAKRQDGTSVYNHLIVLAQNETGLATLNTLNRLAWEEGFYNKPRIDLDLLEDHNDGLIILSGCLNGLLCKAIERGDMDDAFRTAHRMKNMLPGRFYIEIQTHNPLETNQGLIAIADTLGLPAVITSDCHYARKEDLWVEEAMLILSTNPKRDFDASISKSQKMDVLERFNYLYPDRKMSFQEIEIYLRSREEHVAELHRHGLADRDDLFSNTMEIAKSIGDYPYHEALDLLPRPKNGDPDAILEKKARAGLKKRGFDKNPEYVARLEEELAIIKAKGFSTYFLIVENMITWAKKNGIRVGPGRGSAAGSLTCFSLYITEVDPIHYGLLFFRFINPERNDFPDIDVDFQKSRRNEVKEYLRRQFKHVASLATMTYFKDKSMVKDASRAYALPFDEVNKALKGIDAPPTMDWLPLFEEAPKGKDFIKKYPEVMDLAQALAGRIKGMGMHASGIVVAKEPISKYGPIETAKDPDDPTSPRIAVLAMDMREAEKVGFIKLDVLGIKALDIVDDTIKAVEAKHNRKIVPTSIPLDDKRVYAMLNDGYTKAVFQAEGHTFTKWILENGVYEFNDLVIGTSIARPGPLNTVGEIFKRRRLGKEGVSYVHEIMRKHTEETLGVIVYQEQVMQAMTDLGGMSGSEADKVRKIIGKKLDVSEFLPYEIAFVEGASKHVSEEVARGLWEDFKAHAGYSFNKSHAVAYSMMSYWMAWLKYYYPQEFMCAVLKFETDKDSMTDYLIETKRMGLNVLLPHVNSSDAGFKVDGKGIRFGLANIKFISDAGSSKIIQYRPYADYAALKAKVEEKGSGLTTRILGALNAIGGAAFPDNPRTGKERNNFYEYLQIPAFEDKQFPPRVKLQFRDIEDYSEEECFSIIGMVRDIRRGKGWALVDVLDETGSKGIFHKEDTLLEKGQRYAMLIANNRIARYAPIGDVSEQSDNSYCKFLYRTKMNDVTEGFYYVVAFQKYVTKAGNSMAYIVLSDGEKNMTRVMAFPQIYLKAYSQCQEGSVVELTLDKTEDGSIYIKEIHGKR